MKNYKLSHVATGDILRKEISDQTPLGLQAKKIISEGGLVSVPEIHRSNYERTHQTQLIHPEGFCLTDFPEPIFRRIF